MHLILLHGLPATGKTTLGRQIADKLGVPFISRDRYKEKLYEVLENGDGGIEWSRQLGAASFEIVYAVLEDLCQAGTDCVVETYWTPKFAEPKLNDLISRYQINSVQIFCHADATVLAKRFADRAKTTRHPAHMDEIRLATTNTDLDYNHQHPGNIPLNIPGPCLTLDTTDPKKINLEILLKTIKYGNP
jgi:predicted kinase